MRHLFIFLSSALFFLVGVLVGAKTPFFQWFVAINWDSSGVANGISAIVGIGTVSAVIVALYQSKLAKEEAEKNRRDAIDSQTEKLKVNSNHMVQPPSMQNYIGITVTNTGKVAVPIQSLSWMGEGASTALWQSDFAQRSYKLPYILQPGERLPLLIDLKVMINLARYAFEYCNGDPSKIKAFLSSNLNTFVCQLDTDLCKMVLALMDSKEDFIKGEIDKAKAAQAEYDERKNESAWMDEFNDLK